MNAYDETVPAVSICLPVYNGEPYLAAAIESMLAQTFTDFELIISDNASTDRTEQICRKFAEADARIRYYRNERNIGGARNQALAVEYSRGRYVRLSAHDDKLAPTHLEECVAVLEERPEVVIAYTRTVVINEADAEINQFHATRGTADTPSGRFRELMFRNYYCECMYGVIRGDALRSVRPMENFTNSDAVFLCRLAFLGPFVRIDRPLFYLRYHAKNYKLNWRDRMVWYNPAAKGKASFPNWLELSSFCDAVLRAPISLTERLRCGAALLHWIVRYSPNLAKDVVVAASMYVPRARPRAGVYNWE
ncbi:glycosyltransferase family 2 protein [Hyphomicrobium sp.]|uniref:glycosyltransferase family 2 protein n=1 Tax=Hyphomicrobium sp. TaxID=82 RepID=UPI002D7992CA|nr:glycosyltransferase [Hyphomicrobium sp.]HET6389446.1 glycosyltransferase [Hyphomicrobium sp.]